MKLIDIVFSGLIGAVIGAIIIAIYEEYKFQRMNKLNIAREKLEKVYSPLYFLLEKSKSLKEKHEEDLLHSKEEGEFMDSIILRYYYLIDEDQRDDIMLLHSHLRYRLINDENKERIFSKIREGYRRYSKMLGLEENVNV